MFKFANKIFGVLLTVIFLVVLASSLFYMPTAGMDMGGDSNTLGCPFMSHEATLCSMSVLDHIGAWQATFLTLVPSLTLLLSVMTGAILLLAIAPNLLAKQKHRIQPLHRKFTERTYTFSYRPLQELFSNGILHPKLF